jgi:hypothetical protein
VASDAQQSAPSLWFRRLVGQVRDRWVSYRTGAFPDDELAELRDHMVEATQTIDRQRLLIGSLREQLLVAETELHLKKTAEG